MKSNSSALRVDPNPIAEIEGKELVQCFRNVLTINPARFQAPTGVGLEPVVTGTKRFYQVQTVGNTT
jgi:hypothetical protein